MIAKNLQQVIRTTNTGWNFVKFISNISPELQVGDQQIQNSNLPLNIENQQKIKQQQQQQQLQQQKQQQQFKNIVNNIDPLNLNEVKNILTLSLRKNSSLFEKKKSQNIDLNQVYKILNQCVNQKMYDSELFRILSQIFKAYLSQDRKINSDDVELVCQIFYLFQQINFVDKKLVKSVGNFFDEKEVFLSQDQINKILEVFRIVGLSHKSIIKSCEKMLIYQNKNNFEISKLCKVFRDYSIFANSYDLELCEVFTDRLKSEIQTEKISNENVSDALEALANFCHRDNQLIQQCMDILQQQQIPQQDQQKEYIYQQKQYIQILSNVVRDTSKLGYFDENFFEYTVEQCMNIQNELDHQFLCELLWSMGVGNFWPENLWKILIEHLQYENLWSEFSEGQLQKLFQCALLMSHENLPIFWEPIPRGLKEYLRHIWTQQQYSQSSYIQYEVFKCLKRLGYKCEFEHIIQSNTFIVDINIVVDDRKIAVEVDGPEHFTKNRPFKPLGKTLARNRLLENEGYEIVQIPFFEYDYVHKQKDQLIKYLEQKLTDEIVSVAQLQ